VSDSYIRQMMYSHSRYPHPLATALGRVVEALIAPNGLCRSEPAIELIPIAPAAELAARAEAAKKADAEFRRRRHQMRMLQVKGD
jgi:hypothetical protein